MGAESSDTIAHGHPGMPKPGDVVAGKYAIERVLGEGGMGIVYEATHLRLRQRVAVKMLLPDMLAHQVIITRFEREARAAVQLRSRHVARVTDVDVNAEGVPYMVMEFLEGHDLQNELERRGRFPVEEAIEYVLQACAAMIEAHHVGIVHRDLKPSNLFLANDGGGQVVKLLDFGISKVQSEGDAKLTTAEAVMGTAMYMSPEQVRSTQNVDSRSDIWALGVILYELLSGRAPFTGSPTQVAAAIVSEDPPDIRGICPVPDDIWKTIQKALQRNVDMRFSDVRSFAATLLPFAGPSSLGRVSVEALLGGGGMSGSYPRVSMAAPMSPSAHPSSNPIIAPAVSEAKVHDATAPGWTQPGAGAKPKRTTMVGIVLAALALLAGAVVAILYVRSHATTTPAAASSAPAPSATIAAAPPSATVSASPPATTVPSPPVTVATTEPSAIASARTPPRGAAPKPPTSAKPKPPTPAPTTPKPQGKPPGDNPLLL